MQEINLKSQPPDCNLQGLEFARPPERRAGNLRFGVHLLFEICSLVLV